MPRIGQIGGITPKLTFDWEIRDFFSLSDKPGDSYDSPSFSFHDSRWFLRLYPNESEAKVGLYLMRGDSGPPKTVSFTLGFKSSDGFVKERDLEYKFSRKDGGYGSPEFLSRSDLNDRKTILMPNNVLTLRCVLRSDDTSAVKVTPASTDQAVQVALVDAPPASTDQAVQAVPVDAPPANTDQAVQAVPVGEDRLLKSLLSILESGDDSDVVIKVGGKEFPAHRAILRASSAVFGSMFAHEMVEKNSGVVNIKDSDSGTFSEFLVYIYSGSCVLSEDNARSLYELADKYDVGGLKEACSEFLKRNITVDCFCDVIALAVKHSDMDLIECATRFFCDNTVDVVKTVAWQTFLAENSTVGNELFLKAASKFTAQ